MGQPNTKHTTRVANAYHEDIRACVTANIIEVYDEEMGINANIGWGGAVAAGAAYNNHQKRKFERQDPGFSTITPGSHFGFPQFGPDGRVFVTIKIGPETPHKNVQVHNNSNVLVAKDGSLRNVRPDQIFAEATLESHDLKEDPARRIRSIDDISKQDLELISLAKPHSEVDSGEALQRYIRKASVKKHFGTEGKGAGQLDCPRGICSTAADDIVVADLCNHRIQIFDVNGRVKGCFGGEGSAEGQFNHVYGVCVTSRGRIVASDSGNNRIQIFDEHGRFVRMFGTGGSGDGKLNLPFGVATDESGLIYVCDCTNDRVQVFSEKGEFVRKFGSDRLKGPRHLSVTPNGRVIVTDEDNRVHVFDSHGRHLLHFGTKGTREGQFQYPAGVATDADGNIIVCDSGNHRVQVFTSHGAFVSCFGIEGSEDGPEGVCLLSDGGIAVTDLGNDRVQIF